MSRAQSLVLVPRARNGPYGVAAVLHDAIEDVIDIDAYNRELEAEEKDSAEIIAVQKQALEFLKSLKLIEPEPTESTKPVHGQVSSKYGPDPFDIFRDVFGGMGLDESPDDEDEDDK